MANEPNPSDIIIKAVTPSTPIVGVGQQFTIDVTVFAPDEDFEDEVGYRLYCYVCPCGGDGPKDVEPKFFTGHVNTLGGCWTTPQADFTFTVTAGATPSLYNITAVLLEGTHGVPDPSDLPSVVCTQFEGAVIVV